jgi:hypothetical protein
MNDLTSKDSDSVESLKSKVRSIKTFSINIEDFICKIPDKIYPENENWIKVWNATYDAWDTSIKIKSKYTI